MNNNEAMAKHIWHDILQRSMKPFSWGFEFGSVSVIPGGTSFKVCSKIIGLVKIQQKEQQKSFSVTILPDNVGGILEYEANPDNLVSVIDRVVREGVLVDNRESQGYRIAV